MAAAHDFSRYRDLFLQEAEEQIALMERETLLLEADASQERLQSIFRAAHTVKGSSRTMGFDRMADFAHEMENLLDRLRRGEAEATGEACDLLLACTDQLARMREGIAAGRDEVDEDAALLRRLCEACAVGVSTPLMRASIRFDDRCAMPGVRALMAVGAVRESGEVVECRPDLDADPSEFFANGLELIFRHPGDPSDVRERIQAVGEVSSVEVELWREPAIELVADRAEAAPTVRVDVGRLDALMDLVGELVAGRTRLAQLAGGSFGRLGDAAGKALAEVVDHVGRVTGRLQTQVTQARMLPIDVVFSRLPRVVRDLAQELGKQARLEVLGAETEVDRSVIEVIADPLLHILRNCLDHGIEAPEERAESGKPPVGRILLSARHEDGHIVVEVEDDGRGIDVVRLRQRAVAGGMVDRGAAQRMGERESLNLIFVSGVSTSVRVTDVSGRGVGMDVVRANVQRLGGLIGVDSTPGRGAKFTLRLPLTLAIIRGLLVGAGDRRFVLPLAGVVEILCVPQAELRVVHLRQWMSMRGETIPLVHVADCFGGVGGRPFGSEVKVVVVGLAARRVGLAVDDLLGEHEVVFKPLNPYLGEVRGIGGATILGDGEVALIVDLAGVLGANGALV